MPTEIKGQPSRRRGSRRGKPILKPMSVETRYRVALIRLNRLLKQQTSLISQMFVNGETEKAIIQRVQRELEQANIDFDDVAERITTDMIRATSESNKRRTQSALRKALGVNSVEILDTPEVREVIENAFDENINLIKTIPEEHFNLVKKAVIDNFKGEKFREGSLVDRLVQIGGITDNRARRIARDQTAKFNTSISAERQQSVGISKYRWRTSKDIRVTGAPGGPNRPNSAHGNHFEREGKVFSWSKPPPDGHPGQAILCRCTAEPILNIDEILSNAVRIQ